MIIYTDGACSKNGTATAHGGFGVVILDDNQELITTYKKHSECTTNNREEMKAILYALLTCGKNSPRPVVYSDSAYAVNTFNDWMWGWANRGWVKSDNKTPENLDIVKAFYEYWNKGYRIELRKCIGHSGNPWNEMADRLAVAAKEAKK